METKVIKRLAYLVLAFVPFLFYGCGGRGGGGSSSPTGSTVTGVAAAGAPLIGQVSLKDSAGNLAPGSPKTLNSDGSFSFNVSGMAAPYFLQAQGTAGGTEFTMYSVSLGTGTANINPMSNIAVAAMAGVNDPATAYASPGTYATNMTQTRMNTVVANMQAMTTNILTPYGAGSTNPVTGSYTANHQGLDAAFDVSQMNLASGNVTIVDKTSGTSGANLGTATISQMMGSTPPTAVAAVSNGYVPTDLQSISTMLSNMGTALNKGSNVTTTDLDPYFASTNFGINNGMTRTQLMSNIQSDISSLLGGRTISGVTGVTFNGNKGGGYIVSFQFRMSDGSSIMSNQTFSDEFVMSKNSSGTWQITGNGYNSFTQNSMLNQQWQTATGNQTQAGMFFDMSDPANLFKAAVITGTGLPVGGVEMIKETADPTIFMLQTPDTALPSKSDKFYPMTDGNISSIPDNGPFTFSFYSSLPPRNNPMEQRIMTFPKRCLTSTEVAATTGLFSTVTPTGNLDTHTFSTMMGNMMGGMMGGMMSMPFTYTTPTGLPVTMMTSKFSVSSSSFSNETTQGISLNGTSSTMQMQGPTGSAPTSGSGYVDVRATDAFGRTSASSWMFQ
jgi:predicted lipid-binding transport protein (Tim44 family)